MTSILSELSMVAISHALSDSRKRNRGVAVPGPGDPSAGRGRGRGSGGGRPGRVRGSPAGAESVGGGSGAGGGDLVEHRRGECLGDGVAEQVREWVVGVAGQGRSRAMLARVPSPVR